MKSTPFLYRANAEPLPFKRMPLSGSASAYDEAFIQKLAFENPTCLPIEDIDRAYENLVPVCMELNRAVPQI